MVIDAGIRPKPLEIAGAGDVPMLNSTSIMELDELVAEGLNALFAT